MIKAIKNWFSKRSISFSESFEKVFLASRRTNSGTNISEEKSLSSSGVFSCVRVLSETIASLPFHTYKNIGDLRQKVNQDILNLFQKSPNDYLTAYQLKEMIIAHIALWGNFYAEIEYNKAGKIIGLWPLNPSNVTIYKDSNTKEIVYQVIIDGQIYNLNRKKVFHVAGLSLDGIKGLSVIQLHRESIGLSLAMEEFAARYFGEGTRPSGIVTHPGALTKEAAERLKESLAERHAGLGKSHRIMVLEEGMQWNQITIPPGDSQFIEQRKFQINEIARIFRVPPHLVGDLERATFSNIEQQSIEFVIHTITPWVSRIESAINKSLIDDKDVYCKFGLGGLLRGDIKSRYASYAVGRQWGWLSANDIRKLEDMNPIENGDVYLSPLNMTNMDNLADTTTLMEGDDEKKRNPSDKD